MPAQTTRTTTRTMPSKNLIILIKMKFLKRLYVWMAATLLIGSATIVTSCGDDIPADSYYTFTGEMLTGYLQNPEHGCTEFSKIVERAGKSALFSAYGNYTCLAPTDEAVEQYLKMYGYSSIDQIPVEICDTIVRTAVFANNTFNVVDFNGLTSTSAPNMLNNYLQIDATPVTNAQGDTTNYTYKFNDSGEIILTHSNDSVENGIVHQVNAVVMASSGELPDLMKLNPKVSLYSQALQACGIDKKIRLLKDPSWDPEIHRYREGLYHSDNHDNYCHVPDERRYGFMAFIVPDSVLEEKYGITTLEQLYEEAARRYPAEAARYSSTADAMSDLNNEKNPLNRMIAYHILPFTTTLEMLTSICNCDYRIVNPVEWYRTLDPMATMKLELLKVRKHLVDEGTAVNDLFINRNIGEKVKPAQAQRGARVTKLMPDYKNNAANGRYYYIDDIISFDETTKEKVFNIRMRMDLYNLFPELFSNNIRKQDTWTYYATTDKTPGIPAENFIFPIGYLDNVEMNADGDFIYQGARNWYWSFQGDEFNLRSDNNSYDITFRLPTVPTGTYQIRLGFCTIPSRGIGQFYIDGKPQGIPLDMRSDDANCANRYGWKPLSDYSASQVEEKEAMKKNFHNQGWYHGAGAYYCMPGQSGHPDANGYSVVNGQTGQYYCNIRRTVRRVIASNMTLNEEDIHTMRIKSVLALGGAELMIDYIEIVPKSVYGVDTDGEGEDEY